MVIKTNGTARSTENFGGNMDFFTVYSLVDITDTGVSDPRVTPQLPYLQAQNLNSLIQLIGLRIQPVLVQVDKYEGEDMADYVFGTNFTGEHTVWVLKFATERAGFSSPELLRQDSDGLPIIAGLTETATFSNAVINAYSDTEKNIYFIQHETL
jgi:hypothetical protein